MKPRKPKGRRKVFILSDEAGNFSPTVHFTLDSAIRRDRRNPDGCWRITRATLVYEKGKRNG